MKIKTVNLKLDRAQSPQSSLRVDSHWGLFLRVVFFVGLMLVAFAIAMMFNHFVIQAISTRIAFAMLLVVLIPMTVGVILAEIPRGEEWAMGRLGLATFCRTGLPLLIVLLVDALSEGKLGRAAYGFLSFFYLIGFPATVGISIARFKAHEPVDEVDRAVI